MPAIGITGGIATGKSAFCECLRELMAGSARRADQTVRAGLALQRGVPTIKFFDADLAARELVNDASVRTEIEAEFGPDIFSGAGDLNREQLRAIVFRNADKRRSLENILHPRIRRQWSAEAQNYCNSFHFFFADIPLLYETGGEQLCDRVVVVACAPSIQVERLVRRGSIEQAEAEQMIASQMPLEEKIGRADHVVWNDGDRSVLSNQAKLLVDLWRTETWTTK